MSNSTNLADADIEYLPLFTNEVRLFEIKEDSQKCSKIHEVLYSKAHNLCFEVNNSCSFSALAKEGFIPVDKSLDPKAWSASQSDQDIAYDPPPPQLEGEEQSFSSQLESAKSEGKEMDLHALVKNCQLFVSINDLKPEDFNLITLDNYNYEADPNLMCSMQMESLVNFKKRTCLLTTNGCQSQFAREKGFVSDYYSICPQEI